MKMKNDQFDDRMKQYESQTTSTKLIKRLPIICRLDGRSFSSFTKGLKRPYDERLSNLMIETTKYLVKETNANCGYQQSDEISLLWYSDDYNTQPLFDGKVFKLTSILASLATGFFNKNLPLYIPEKKDFIPVFDARVYNVPNLTEAVNSFLWREQDATKNSISMAAQSVYSHKQLEKKNGKEKQEMLFQKGINWSKDYPCHFKRGTYVQRKRLLIPFTLEEIEKLPAKHNARKNPNMLIERWVVDVVDLPPLSKIENKIDVIVWGKDYKPIVEKEA